MTATLRAFCEKNSRGCCAYAGDRGMLHPELTEAATVPEAAEVAGWDADAHASCNRTCELGMTKATGEPYVHVLELLEKATRERVGPTRRKHRGISGRALETAGVGAHLLRCVSPAVGIGPDRSNGRSCATAC